MTAYWNGRKACIKVTFHKQTTNGCIFPVRPLFYAFHLRYTETI